MWLLDTSTLELRDFVGADIPPYAILSHTWGPDEVSFRDMSKDRKVTRLRALKAGYAKVQKCCEKALQDGHKYVWIDTCCIDKRSSAELSEAINTMYRWYQDAQVCYAYLSDVPSEGFDPYYAGNDDAFSKSRWFTRGWTLQELIGPRNIQFLSQDWRGIGSKAFPRTIDQEPETEESIRRNAIFLSKLARITGIGEAVLSDSSNVRRTFAAQRMAWAARRQTAREEDLAYALMGLFSVSMPILYGEGLKKAFRRLQLEIIRMNSDQSIFVWQADRASSGLLAESPHNFAASGLDFVWKQTTLRPYSMTNIGLLVDLPLWTAPDGSLLLAIRCWVKGERSRRIGLYLEQVKRPVKPAPGSEKAIYRRTRCETFERLVAEDCPDYFSSEKGENDPGYYRGQAYILEDEHYEHILWVDSIYGDGSEEIHK